MADYSATIDVPGKGGDIGTQFKASGYYALTGAITGHATTGDTITFTNILPFGGAKVLEVEVVCPELDTDATPTGTMIVGNSDDDNGFITTQNVGKPAQLPANGAQLIAKSFDGALLNTHITNRDIIIEFTAALATSATSGTVRLNVLLEAVAA